VLDQSDRDQTQFGLQLRAGYEVMPGVQPWVQGQVDTRRLDQKYDDSGYERSSNGVGAMIGSTFELSRLLTGEIGAGYQRRRYEDPRLRDSDGPLADAALIWSATPLTTVKLRGTSQILDTTVASASGALYNAVTLELQHDLRRNWRVSGALTVAETDYEGAGLKEDLLAASVKLDYRLTRTVAVKASFTHERLRSNAVGDDYTANIYLVGLRLQR
jgi:hypothetical protein